MFDSQTDDFIYSSTECFVSGSRDGSFKIWDLRQNFSFRDADPETHTLYALLIIVVIFFL